jgi:uncharacterized membrane protein YfcA
LSAPCITRLLEGYLNVMVATNTIKTNNGYVVKLGVLTSGLIVWKVAAVAVGVTWLGGYIGGKMAVKKGDGFIMNVMVIMMLISAVALIAGA